MNESSLTKVHRRRLRIQVNPCTPSNVTPKTAAPDQNGPPQSCGVLSSPLHYVYLSKTRIMASSTLLAPSSDGSRFNTVLWISLGLTTLFVVITSEALLVTDYPMYHAYRLQVIADRHLLIPHTLCGVIALLAGPLQFSSRLRQRHLKFHRILGRIYVISVFIGALTGIALAAGRPGMPGTCVQAAAWVICTTAALI